MNINYLIFLTVFVPFLYCVAFMMLFQPKRYFELFCRKPIRLFGLEVSIIHEKRFLYWFRGGGILVLLIGVALCSPFMLAAVFWMGAFSRF